MRRNPGEYLGSYGSTQVLRFRLLLHSLLVRHQIQSSTETSGFEVSPSGFSGVFVSVTVISVVVVASVIGTRISLLPVTSTALPLAPYFLRLQYISSPVEPLLAVS